MKSRFKLIVTEDPPIGWMVHCSNDKCNGMDIDDVIPVFSYYTEAQSVGWLFLEGGINLCPNCSGVLNGRDNRVNCLGSKGKEIWGLEALSHRVRSQSPVNSNPKKSKGKKNLGR